jgi:hypothetical protein
MLVSRSRTNLAKPAITRHLPCHMRKTPRCASRGAASNSEATRDRSLHHGRALVHSVADLDPRRRFVPPAERPRQWTGAWVCHRLVEAFEVERRIPDRRVGPALMHDTWRLTTTASFSDRVNQGELAREHVWDSWSRAAGARPFEVSRMDEALSWPSAILANGRAVEGRCLLLCIDIHSLSWRPE